MDVAYAADPRVSKRRGIEEAIRRAVATGALPLATRIPSARELAIEFGVARGTVVAAIDDLVADGLLVTRPREGTYVARRAGVVDPPPSAGLVRPPRFDLRPGRPETGSFPVARWAAAVRRAAAAMTDTLDDDGAGSLALRTELAAYLARARGVEATAETIVVSAGYRSASTVLAAVLRAGGATRVALEDPGLAELDRTWRAAGLEVADLPVDGSGARTEVLDAAVDAAVLTPAHQFPLGGALTADRRRSAVAWATARGGLLVEDDYDGEFRFDRRPVAALQRSAPEHVVYLGSVSKTLDARLRLGWMVLPHELVAPARALTLALTGGVALIDQLALAELIRAGDFERHIRRQRREYARRRRVLQQAAADAGLELPGIPAGLQTVIPLPAGWGTADPDGVIRARGLVTHSLSRYTRTAVHPRAVVAGFGTPARAAFEPAVGALMTWLRATPTAEAEPDER